MAQRHPIGPYLRQMCSVLEISPQQVLRRVGLSPTLASAEEINVDADTYFRLWEALRAEANRPGIEMQLAMMYAHGPFVPPIFAFSCAETLGLGLRRLADFKLLVGPISMDVTRRDTGLTVTLRPSEPGLTTSPSHGLFEILYITECARTFTGKLLRPTATSLPGALEVGPETLDYLGGPPQLTGEISLTFAPRDAELPLITSSAAFWEMLEPGFLEQLQQRSGAAPLSGRVKRALAEALPGGSASVDDMARRLNVSKRSLQRKLSEEGTSFQELLNETRFEMSERYLRNSGLSLPEISCLLGFRETSSFFRAFQGWTGTTPGDYRTTRANGAEPGE